jgi:hypothetical protein
MGRASDHRRTGKMKNPRGLRLTISLALMIALTACAGQRRGQVTFHDPNMDFSLIQTAAVMPFANLTNDLKASDRVRELFITMLQATGAMYVLPPGEVGRGVDRASLVNPSAPTPEEIVAFANIVGADAVFTGSVLEYGQVRSGATSANVVTVSLQLIEAATGRVVWSASSSKGGITAGDRMFGGGGEPMNPVTVEAVDELLDLLFAG